MNARSSIARYFIHIQTSISFEDDHGKIKSIWQDQVKHAGWNLGIQGKSATHDTFGDDAKQAPHLYDPLIIMKRLH
jgi:hypothetical protein